MAINPQKNPALNNFYCNQKNKDGDLSESSYQDCLAGKPYKTETEKQEELFLILGACIVFILLGIILFKIRKKVRNHDFRRSVYKVLTGWLIWCLSVLSYSYLLETEALENEELLLGWFILPPVLALLFLWWKNFFNGQR